MNSYLQYSKKMNFFKVFFKVMTLIPFQVNYVIVMNASKKFKYVTS